MKSIMRGKPMSQPKTTTKIEHDFLLLSISVSITFRLKRSIEDAYHDHFPQIRILTYR